MSAFSDMSLGLIGLGVMGENLALNFERHGFAVCGFDLNPERRQRFTQLTQGLQAATAEDLTGLLAKLSRPRRILLMVPAGAAVDALLTQLRPLLAPGDVLIDGGNTLYTDTQRRMQALQGTGIHYIGMGVSGGQAGALRGPALMPGGSAEAWPQVASMLQAIAAKADDGQPCVDWMGPAGAGHFVKMVHNGIEYADMQMICEAWWLMQQLLGLPPARCSAVFREWNQGELGSYLIGITADILATQDPQTGQALVELILDTAEQKGTGQWSTRSALELGVPAPTMAEAVFARSLSALKNERVAASGVLSGPRPRAGADAQTLLPQIRHALLAAKVCAYAQGFALMQAANRDYHWDLPLGRIAGIWRAGCIIRAHLLEDIRRALLADAGLPNLLMDSHLARLMAEIEQDLREVVARAALQGVAVPALMSALSYYDGYRAARLPAHLLQAQRDFFGAHTYQRIDRPGHFHTHWNG